MSAGTPHPRREGLRLGIILRLSLRNVLRYARRSTLTASAMVLGLALLIFSRTLADGAHESWIDQGVQLGTGHVALQAPGYQQNRSLDHRLSAGPLATAMAALGDPQVEPSGVMAAPRLAVSGLASSAGSAVPIQILGVDPDIEPAFSLLDDKLVEGRYLESGDRLSAYVGTGLVERLGIHLGSRFVLTAQDADDEIQGQLVRVAGIFRTGVPDLDEGIIHLTLSTAQRWLGAPGAVTTVAVLLQSSRETPWVIRSLERTLPADRIEVLSWREVSPELDAAVKIDDLGDWVFHSITLAIIALAILNAILMAVMHRRREFGVLQALGLTARETGVVVLLEGVMLSLLSGGLGVLLGLGVTWFFWRDGLDMSFLMDEELTFSGTLFDPVMIPEFRLSTILLSLALIIAIGVLASLYPARQATRIDVAEAMKFDR